MVCARHRIFKTYNSSNSIDKKFYSQGNALSQKWTQTSFAHPMFTDVCLIKTISHALLSHIAHKTTTLLLLPLFTLPETNNERKQKLRSEYNTLLKHPLLLPLTLWAPNTFPFNSGNREEDPIYIQQHLALYITATQYPSKDT